MSIDPIFWLLAAVGFLALEGMTFSKTSHPNKCRTGDHVL